MADVNEATDTNDTGETSERRMDAEMLAIQRMLRLLSEFDMYAQARISLYLVHRFAKNGA